MKQLSKENQDWLESKVRFVIVNKEAYYRDSDVEEKIIENQTEIERLKSELNRVSEFLKFHIERWDGIEPIDPSIQVLKRCLPEELNK